jgi:hypothetical protein
MAPPAILDLKRQRFQVSPAHEGFETKAHGVRIHACQFSDTHPHFANMAVRKSPGFGADRVKNRIGNPHLVHRQP